MDKRPFNDELAEKVIDAQVKEIDRLHATNKDILRVNLEHANNIVQMKERITELENQLEGAEQRGALILEVIDERDRLKATLTKIASQHTLKEHEQLDTGDGDVEYAYDAIIGDARNVLQNKEEPTK